MSAILQIHSQDSSATPQPAQISVGRVDYLDQCGQYAIVLTCLVASDHTSPVTSNQRRSTNPIGRERVSGFAQSGFNEVAHSAMIPAFRRATSQNPPDSQSVRFLIQPAGWEWRLAGMARPYSNDLRERAATLVVSGRSCREVASLFGVSVASVVRWSQRQRLTGTAASRRMGGHRKRLLEPHRALVIDQVKAVPDITQGAGGGAGRTTTSRGAPMMVASAVHQLTSGPTMARSLSLLPCRSGSPASG